MESFLEEGWRALRLLRRSKRFAALAILSLGVAIALNTTMYSVLDAMINPKLTIHEPERLFEAPYFGDYRRRLPVRERNREIMEQLGFHAGAAGFGYGEAGFPYGDGSNTIERGARLRSARVLTVTPNYFGLLGVRAIGGRLLAAGDETSDAVVLSQRMWKHLFPERETFSPGPVLVDGQARTVVGVLPYEADYPGAYTDVWRVAPPAVVPNIPLRLFRLRDGVTPQQAEAELQGLNQRIIERTGDMPQHAGFRFRRWIQPQFANWGFNMALAGAVLAVLLIACANLANLQLARGVARTRELATRAAVGASRGALVRQLVMETGWLALGGLVLGGVLTFWGMRIVETSVPETLAEYVTRPQMSWRVLLFAVLTTVFSLGLVGFLPAIRLSRVDVGTLLKSGAGTGQSRRARRQYAGLVIVEVALALSVVAGAMLLTRAALTLHVDLPESYERLASAYVPIQPLPGDVRSRRDWSNYVVQHMLRDSGVVDAATVTYGYATRRAVSVDDPGGAPRVFPTPMGWGYQVVSPGILRTLQLQIIEGRDFSPGEFAEPQVIVDRATARHLWPGTSPIGQLIKLDSPRVDAPWMRVVGVADALFRRSEMMDERRQRAIPPSLRGVYVLNAHDTAVATKRVMFQLVVRGRGDVRRLPVIMRRALATIPGALPTYPQTFADQLGFRVQRERHDFIASLFIVFAICSIALAGLGVYSIVSHSVAQRTREFGVRVAVGASASEIRSLVLREGNVLALSGIAIGLLITAWSAGLLRAFLFSDYDRYDSPLFALTALLLFVVAWTASYIPARRATRIDPVEALRND